MSLKGDGLKSEPEFLKLSLLAPSAFFAAVVAEVITKLWKFALGVNLCWNCFSNFPCFFHYILWGNIIKNVKLMEDL